jgi:hypothetical protein
MARSPFTFMKYKANQGTWKTGNIFIIFPGNYNQGFLRNWVFKLCR